MTDAGHRELGESRRELKREREKRKWNQGNWVVKVDAAETRKEYVKRDGVRKQHA